MRIITKNYENTRIQSDSLSLFGWTMKLCIKQKKRKKFSAQFIFNDFTFIHLCKMIIITSSTIRFCNLKKNLKLSHTQQQQQL